jgi:phage terminase large subunit-like protein
VTRRFLRCLKTFFLFVAKKNGKSLMASPASLYSLYFDEEFAGLVVSAVTTREQAKVVFRDADLIAKK